MEFESDEEMREAIGDLPDRPATQEQLLFLKRILKKGNVSDEMRRLCEPPLSQSDAAKLIVHLSE